MILCVECILTFVFSEPVYQYYGNTSGNFNEDDLPFPSKILSFLIGITQYADADNHVSKKIMLMLINTFLFFIFYGGLDSEKKSLCGRLMLYFYDVGSRNSK
uniref:Uncharacterized protein n=1 Tax=Arundo donax TaxID=35708 RepID=A0A0A9HJ59_ARUDO